MDTNSKYRGKREMESFSSLNIQKAKSPNIKYNVEIKEMVFYDFITSCLDLIVALIGLIITLPVILLVGILIKIEDNGPVFYKQERMGKDGKHFWIYKLRSMKIDAEKYGMQWAEKDDTRITKIGKFIRKTRIDELPQLINIINGDMKLIGPRPERPELTMQFNEVTPGFINRLVVKPGMTGWAQVNGGYDISHEEKLELDIYYINNRSMWMDIQILCQTIRVVLTGDGAR